MTKSVWPGVFLLVAIPATLLAVLPPSAVLIGTAPLIGATYSTTSSTSSGIHDQNPIDLVDWNIQYGQEFDGVLKVLRGKEPEICLLQEVDLNTARSGKRNIAEDLAKGLLLNYVFAPEFQELSQTSNSSPAYTGQAILSNVPIQKARVINFTNQTDSWQPRFFLPRWSVFQPRHGGRIALVAEVVIGGKPVVIYNTHLESRESDRLRLNQLEEILNDVKQYPETTRIIVAGDLNNGKDSSEFLRRLSVARFHSVITPGAYTTPKRTSKDWIFVRGSFGLESPLVDQTVFASDHFPVTVRIN
jgi:endonuclease/exonuclease/phosphatase family metal-dependent hydrolase